MSAFMDCWHFFIPYLASLKCYFFIFIKYYLSTGSCQSLTLALRFASLNSLFCPGMHFYSSPYIDFILMWSSSIWEQLHQTFVWVFVFSIHCIHSFVLHVSLFFSKLNDADKTIDKLNYKPGDEVICFASKVAFYSLRKKEM